MNTQPHILFFSEIQEQHLGLVGGKGLSLAQLTQNRLPVPPGFCVTTPTYHQFVKENLSESVREEILHAYEKIGGGLVAVRSSATSEDGASYSFAGQQETFLGIEGGDALIEAIQKCWYSLNSDRARSYRAHQGVEDRHLAMAVVVQKLIDADVAGVLFTVDPLESQTGDQQIPELMLVEASWGLGEAVVSGAVQPDRFQIRRKEGGVHSQQLGSKKSRFSLSGKVPVPTELQQKACLNEDQIKELVKLGLKIEEFAKAPRDIEWAFHQGKCWLLQSRPITSAFQDREKYRKKLIDHLRQMTPPGGTIWFRFFLVEVLPAPTPLTWSLLDRFMLSGSGGTGKMYKEFGFVPAKKMENRSIYDLIAGRPYVNLAIEVFLQAEKPLFGYPLDKYRENLGLISRPKIDTSKKLRGFFGSIASYWSVLKSTKKITSSSKTFAHDFRSAILVKYLENLKPYQENRLEDMGERDLLAKLTQLIQLVLVDFASQSLKPTLFADFSLQVLEIQLKKYFSADVIPGILAELGANIEIPETEDLAHGIQSLSRSEMPQVTFLERFGHRGANEMELANPRWDENPDSIFARIVYDSSHKNSSLQKEKASIDNRWKELVEQGKIPSIIAKYLWGYVQNLRIYFGLREVAKHYFLLGYQQIRRYFLQIDRQYQLGGKIFYFTWNELVDLVSRTGIEKNHLEILEERVKEHRLALSLEVPVAIDSNHLDVIGKPIELPEHIREFKGTPLSPGSARATALVLTEISEVPKDLESYILICPSTDPAWVPLFVRAKGLVMESGGVLSHGAIVAREFALPAVANLPGILQQIKMGDMVHIDGNIGKVIILDPS